MSLLRAEIKANAEKFGVDWRSTMQEASNVLAQEKTCFLESYERIVSLNAWRQHIENLISEESLAFFLEAQNDALTSHVFAALGSWRSALKALRSCIDNVLFCIYYKDHPVELELWKSGKHKPTFSELFTYCEQHPCRLDVLAIDGIPMLRAEYSTLSKAVHSSAARFRMTLDIRETLLWSSSKNQLGMWQSRERSVLIGINLLLLSLFRESLAGSAAAGLRAAIAITIPAAKFPSIKTHYKVVLRNS
jgi:hypothetical protein